MTPASEILILYGPTASGKSALALQAAQALDGIIINADSMQLYRDLPLLTAAPSPVDLQAAPHRLYGYVDAATAYSAARWVEDAVHEIRLAWAAGKRPILVGGTGLYLRALMQGFSPIPDISTEIRDEVRRLPLEEIQARLTQADPASIARLEAGDSQRLTRAYEVFAQTGRPLSYWQAQPPVPAMPDAAFRLLLLDLPRELLYARCDARLEAMVKAGALEELEQLRRRDLPQSLPAMRAVGVPELMAHLHGEATLETALPKAQQATRNYAKRQLTWGRNQFADAPRIAYPYDTFLPMLVKGTVNPR